LNVTQRIAGVALALLAVAASPAWGATTWRTDAATSTLKFVATQAGGEFEGRFKRFTPAIVFAPGDLAHSRFTVEIDATSAETGEAERDNTLKGKDFFAVAQWPAAHFETLSFRTTGAASFEATGKLTLRNVTREVRLPFTFTPSPDGSAAVLAGGTTIQRLDFGVGQGEWSDTQWVGADVRIRFELHLKQASP
jgi:polyisoprenoid-binding protein YceI